MLPMLPSRSTTAAATLAALLASSSAAAECPCDILVAAGNPCVAAHSTVRALYSEYTGPLYKVSRTDGSSANVGVLEAGGFANISEQETFCTKGDCVISKVYDQSPEGNHLTQRISCVPGQGCVYHKMVNASKHMIAVRGGRHVAGMWLDPGYGYDVDVTKNIAKGNEPESIYAVMSGTHYNGNCCFDVSGSVPPAPLVPGSWQAAGRRCLSAGSPVSAAPSCGARCLSSVPLPVRWEPSPRGSFLWDSLSVKCPPQTLAAGLRCAPPRRSTGTRRTISSCPGEAVPARWKPSTLCVSRPQAVGSCRSSHTVLALLLAAWVLAVFAARSGASISNTTTDMVRPHREMQRGTGIGATVKVPGSVRT
eukprot:SAG22_NODE_913_length_6527_cov_2.919726_4_plen_365_part_00